MDVAWLESFLALLEHGSFTRAAEAQHLSQPAFSRRIRSLEQWAGAELVDRSIFPVSLTPAGLKVRRQAAEVVADLAAIRDEIRGRQPMPQEAIRLSISHTLATYYFADWWKRITGDAFQLTCLLLPSNTFDAYDSLIHGECDLVLAYADPAHPLGIDHSKIESLVVAHDRLAPYVKTRGTEPQFMLPGSPRHPVPFVSHGSGAFLGRVTDRLLATCRPYLRPVAQSDLTSALAHLVFAGIGVGWLPGVLTRSAVTDGNVAELDDAAWSADLEIRLCRSGDRRLSRQVAEVWERTRRNAAGTR